MTAPTRGGADEIREQVAEALWRPLQEACWARGITALDSDRAFITRRQADALLPTVQALIAKGVAAAREQAYWTVLDAGDVWLARDKRSRPPAVAEYLAGLAEDVRDGRQHRVPWPWRVPAEDGTP